MSQRSLVVLTLSTLIIGAGAWMVTQKRTPETEVVKAPLFPDLAKHVNDVSRIEVKSKTQSVIVSAKDDKWVVESRGDFPALAETVKQAVLSTSDLKILEKKTSSKDLYPKLGVEDVDSENSTSKLLTFNDKAGKPVAALIVGKNRTASGPGASALYVRKPGDAQALLVEGDLTASADAQDWIDKELFNVDGNRISEVLIEQPGQKPVRVYRKEPDAKDLTVDNIPAGHKPKSQFTINSLATALEDVRMDDVTPKSGFTFPKEQTTTRFTAYDGLITTVHLAKVNDKTHATFEFAYDADLAAKNVKPTPTPAPTATPAPSGTGTPAATPPAPSPTPEPTKPVDGKKDAETLTAKHGNWVYILPEFKANLFAKKMDDLAGPQPTEKPKSKTGKSAPAPAEPPPGELPPGANPLEGMMPPPGEMEPHSH